MCVYIHTIPIYEYNTGRRRRRLLRRRRRRSRSRCCFVAGVRRWR